MRLAKVISKIYEIDKAILYLLKYLRSSERITLLTNQDCFDLDEIVIVTSDLNIAKALLNEYDSKNSIYLPDAKLCIMKTYYENN